MYAPSSTAPEPPCAAAAGPTTATVELPIRVPKQARPKKPAGLTRARWFLQLILNLILYGAVANRALAIFSAIKDSGDILGHARIAALCAKTGLWPSNFGLYLLTCLGAYPHQNDGDHLYYVLINILLAAVVMKMIVTRRLIAAELTLKANPAGAAAATIGALLLLAAFSPTTLPAWWRNATAKMLDANAHGA